LANLIETVLGLSAWDWVRFVFDVYLVWFVIYMLFTLIKFNVRTVQILKGLVFIYVVNFISHLFDLTALQFLASFIMQFGVLVVIIIFQPEIRGALEQIGLKSIISKQKEEQTLVDMLCQSIDFLSKRRIGALIVIEKRVKLDEFITPATVIDSRVSAELLNTIFIPTTPLHDGAVIIRDEKIYCAGAYLPLTNREDVSKALGTRHRAAIGVSEISDVITLVASEETGTISIAHNGDIRQFENIEKFKKRLELHME